MDDAKLEQLLGGLGKTLEKINARLDKLEANKIDPAKLKASTKDADLPALRVVPPPTGASGTPGGQLEEPWPDPFTARPPTVR